MYDTGYIKGNKERGAKNINKKRMVVFFFFLLILETKEGGVRVSVPLMRNEKLVWSSFPGRNYRVYTFIKDMIAGIIAAILAFAFIPEKYTTISYWIMGISLGICLVIAIFHQLEFLFIRYYITSERIMIRRGILQVKLISLKYEHIINTEIKQTIAERMISTGSIYLFNANDDSEESSSKDKLSSLQNVDDPMKIYIMIQELIEDNELRMRKKASRQDDEE